jgi:hypothetical protein
MPKANAAAQKAITTVETAKMTADEVVSLEMSQCLRRLAKADTEPGEKLKAIYGRLANKTGLTYGQVKRIWKREWKIIPGSVVRKLDNLLSEHERKLNAEFAVIKARTEAIYGRTHSPSDGPLSSTQGNSSSPDMG